MPAAIVLRRNTCAGTRSGQTMARQLVLVAALLLSASFLAMASEAESEHVVNLGTDFDEKVNDGKVWFIKFYAPWCGHCKRLVPTWGELAAQFKENEGVAIAHVDCTVHRDVCQAAQVQGYPTLKIFHKGAEAKAYRGSRDLEALVNFANEAASELLTETTE